ncbi:MAG: hypothetical protein ACR2LL_00390 [Nitrosopumilus sp.]
MKFLLFAFTLLVSSLFLPSTMLTASAEPVEYDVQIIVEGFDTLDYQEESINAYFWVIITSDDDDVDFTKDPPTLHFPDGIILADFQESQYNIIEPHRFVAKVQGEFDIIADFHDYPYEKIQASIAMQIYDKDVSKVILKTNPALHENDIQTPGLVFEGSDMYAQDEIFYDGRTYSQVVVDTVWQHPVEAIFLQEIFPLLVIGAVVIFLIRFQPHNLENKAGAAVGLIFALVAFHGLVIEDAIPDLEYLTFEEKLMIVIYALIVYLLVEVLVQQRYNKGDKEKIKKINNKMTALLPVVVAIVSAGIFFF